MRVGVARLVRQGLIHAIETRDNSTLSVTTARRSEVIGGVVAVIGGTGAPLGMVAEVPPTIALVFSSSMSPTIDQARVVGGVVAA